MMPPPCTITFLQGDKNLIVDGLKLKVNEILLKNPWLTGKLIKFKLNNCCGKSEEIKA